MSTGRPASFDPLDDHDGVPGDSYGVAAAARRYESTADEIASQVANLKKLSDQSKDAWKGKAGDKFGDKASSLADRIGKAEKRYRAAGEALRYFSDGLDEIQERAYDAVRKAQEAEKSLAAHANPVAVPPPPAPGAPPPTPEQTTAAETAAGAERRRQDAVGAARGDLKSARTSYETAKDDYGRLARAAAGRLSERGEGLKDSWMDRNAGWIKKVLTVIAIVLVVLAVVALVICLFVPGLNILVGGMLLTQLLESVMIGLTVLSLGGHIALAATDNGAWSDVVWDVVALASFGAGRLVGKAVGALGGRAAEVVASSASQSAGRAALREGGLPGRLFTSGGSLRRTLLGLTERGAAALGSADEAAAAASSRIAQLSPEAGFVDRLFGVGARDAAGELARLRALAAEGPAGIRAAVLRRTAQALAASNMTFSVIPAIPLATQHIYEAEVSAPREEEATQERIDRISGQWANPVCTVH